MLRLAFITSFVSAIFTVLMLKGLHYFHFIKWHPTKFITFIEEPFGRYVVLAAIVFVVAFIVFWAATVVRFTAVAAFFVAASTVFVVEIVLIEEQLVWKSISSGFFFLTIVVYRFIMETASFHYSQSRRQ